MLCYTFTFYIWIQTSPNTVIFCSNRWMEIRLTHVAAYYMRARFVCFSDSVLNNTVYANKTSFLFLNFILSHYNHRKRYNFVNVQIRYVKWNVYKWIWKMYFYHSLNNVIRCHLYLNLLLEQDTLSLGISSKVFKYCSKNEEYAEETMQGIRIRCPSLNEALLIKSQPTWSRGRE